MDTELDERIDRVYQSANGLLPDRRELKRLSDDFSVDFAALYFSDQIARTTWSVHYQYTCTEQLYS